MLVIDSLLPKLSVVLAAKVEPSPPVVKMAHGGLLKVVDVPSTAPSPTCSLGVPLNVATNSIMWSGVNVASVRTLAPSITSWPPVTTALPPGDRIVADQPAGSPVAVTSAAENSVPTVGFSSSSPFARSPMYPFASSVAPLAVKSATVVSTKCADDTVKLAGVPGAIAEFDDASVDVTR